jgi:hypothetical protein
MKTLKLDHVKEVMEGCVNNDYTMICIAGQILLGLAEGRYEIDAEDNLKRALKSSLYRKFMRAYTRYIIANPNSVQSLSIDCCFTSMINGEQVGIIEP